MLKDIIKTYRDNPGFRPLIRGFFFYSLFKLNEEVWNEVVSVPSFGDSFFIGKNPDLDNEYDDDVSVPSFGDSFFI